MDNNSDKKVKRNICSGEQVRIFDTTLRDGEQTPGVSVNPEKKIKIAIRLDELGVDAIEAGFPIVSIGERESIKAIAKQGLKADIYGLARTVQTDIDAALGCDLEYIHTFIATSEIHMKYKLNMSKEQVLERAIGTSCVLCREFHLETMFFSVLNCPNSTFKDLFFIHI